MKASLLFHLHKVSCHVHIMFRQSTQLLGYHNFWQDFFKLFLWFVIDRKVALYWNYLEANVNQGTLLLKTFSLCVEYGKLTLMATDSPFL